MYKNSDDPYADFEWDTPRVMKARRKHREFCILNWMVHNMPVAPSHVRAVENAFRRITRLLRRYEEEDC